ncbi:MAG TPA: alpha-amylase family glycosyl hydrolase [Pseudonocardiaceae bacterium]
MTGLAWWQQGAIYQIYPRSFADSDGDGVGDLRGVTAHLDYLAELGVTAVWLSPIFPSPMADFGYDVSDYCDIDPVFGSLADLDALVAGCHSRGIKVVLDWVLNHTSDRHPWFVAARSGRDDPRRDWYVWRDGAAGGARHSGPPNNWVAAFQAVGPAWTFDEASGQWYLHSFLPEQPDLNWDNPQVEAAMHDVLRFWLDRGIDGFRLDAVHRLAKDPQLRDNVAGDRSHDEDWDTMPERLRGIRRVVDRYPDRMLVGELYLLDLTRFVGYLNSGDQLHMAHNFVFIQLPWSAEAYLASIDEFETLSAEHTWPAWFLANHDLPRVASRFNVDGQGAARARAVGLMLYALRGTPFIYQGEELGLPDATIPPDRVVDVDGRDPQRAPIPWEPPSVAGPGAGFTTGTPWLPLIDDADTLCVQSQAKDPRSTLALYRRLANLRAATPALQGGTQRLLDAGPDVLAWIREDPQDRLLAAVNFTALPTALALPDQSPDATLVLSTDPDRSADEAHSRGITLGPSEAVLLRIEPTRESPAVKRPKSRSG